MSETLHILPPDTNPNNTVNITVPAASGTTGVPSGVDPSTSLTSSPAVAGNSPALADLAATGGTTSSSTPNTAVTSSVTLPQESTKQSAPIFSGGNTQSDGKNTLKRMEFDFQGSSYSFVLNPEEYTQVEPNRMTVTQTKAGAWVDEFGGGLQVISMKGSTGFKYSGSSDPTTGFTKFKALRDLIRNYYFNQSPGSTITDDLIFHNYTDGEHWAVVPKVFSLMRSVSRPLLYMYSIELICLRPADTPSGTASSTITASVVPLVTATS